MEKRGVVSICLVIGLVMLFSSLVYGEVLSNPGFENNEESWYNWCDGDNQGYISSEYSYSGTSCACREIYGSGRGCYGRAITVNPREKISASVWGMSPSSLPLSGGAEGYLRIEFWNEKGPLGGGHVDSKRVNAASDWVQLQVSARTPVGATEARILAFSYGKETSMGLMCFDDVKVVITKP